MIRMAGYLVVTAWLMFMIAVPSHAADATGIEWQTTSQPVMEGMPMQIPAQHSKLCVADPWTNPPRGGDPSCESSNFERTGTKATWTVECPGQGSGSGEITFNEAGDAYTGTVKFTGGEMPMTVKLTGKKSGTCDNPE